jgi:hypothetical protein
MPLPPGTPAAIARIPNSDKYADHSARWCNLTIAGNLCQRLLKQNAISGTPAIAYKGEYDAQNRLNLLLPQINTYAW